MSVEAITWALKQPVKHSTAKFVLVVIANCADGKDFIAWPSVAYLVESTGQDRKTVLENIKRLTTMGYICDTGERRGATKQIPVYQLTQPEVGDGTENGTVPFSPDNSPKIPGKQSQNSAQTGPKTGHGTVNEPSMKGKEPSVRGSRLPQDWVLLKSWALIAMELQPTWTPEHVRFEADKFKDHWLSASGRNAVKLDWLATWRNWCRNAGAMKADKAGGSAWWRSAESKQAKAEEVGVGPALPGESDDAWQARIQAAIDNGGKPPVPKRKPTVEVRETVEQIDKDAKEQKRGIPEEEREKMLQAAGIRRRAA